MSEPEIVTGNILDDERYTVAQVAKIMSVTEQTVRMWINSNDPKKRLGAIKIGKSWHVTKAALSDFANRSFQ